MPEYCVAYLCRNRRSAANKSRGITFHKFPKDKKKRKKWQAALRWEGFTVSNASVICSEHFKAEDFDRTGQTVRLREGVIPSIFNFPAHLQRPVKLRTTATSTKAKESLPVASTSRTQPPPNDDHCYVLPACPTTLKARLHEALARVESLERDKKNALAREKRAKTTVMSLLFDCNCENDTNESPDSTLTSTR